MTYLSNIEAYIKELCEKHKQLLHGQGGTAFMPMASGGEAGAFYADIKPVYVRIADASHDAREGQITWEVIVEFLANVDISTYREEAISQASNLTQEIMYDFDARIRLQVDESCGFMHTLLPATMQPIGLADQSAFGWSYAWRFTTGMTDYNANAWEE